MFADKPRRRIIGLVTTHVNDVDCCSFDRLRAEWPWRPIPNCPGRFVLATGASRVTPEALAPRVPLVEHRVAGAPDPVVVGRFADGGLISYRKPDGAYVHTLNSRDGMDRKLAQLGIAGDGQAASGR
jgi:hypothetical protein